MSVCDEGAGHAPRELLVIRHGETEMNERKRFTGGQDVPLSEKGRRALSPLFGTYPAAALFFTSGMRRTRETLALLYGDVPSVAISELGETRLGRFEGRDHDTLYKTDPIYRAWLESMEVVPPGGESRRQFDARVVRGFEALRAHGWTGRAVLVAHGGVISSLMRQFAPAGFEQTKPIHNACGWMLRLDAAGNIVEYKDFP